MSTRGYFSQFDADDRPTRTWSGKMQQPNVPVRVLWKQAVLVCEGLPDGTYSRVTTPRQCILLLQSSVSGRSVISPATLQCFAREQCPILLRLLKLVLARVSCELFVEVMVLLLLLLLSLILEARTCCRPTNEAAVRELAYSIPWTLCSVVRGSCNSHGVLHEQLDRNHSTDECGL